MRNHFLDDRTVRDIDKQITKILKDLGGPEPPLHLDLVRELLELDRAYYSTSDADAISETIHRLKIGGKQVIKLPTRLIHAIRKLDIKALWIPDRQRILIDSDLPSAKQRWGEAHEIGHSIIPWHEMVMHGDKKRTLSYTCEQQIEAEANFAAGRLLFLQDRFPEMLNGSKVTFEAIRTLSSDFGNTMTTTLWRAVETLDGPALGLVSQHPRTPRRRLMSEPVRYFLRSRAFEQQFATVTAREVFDSLRTFCFGKKGPVGSRDVVFRDVNGDQHVFFLETFLITTRR